MTAEAIRFTEAERKIFKAKEKITLSKWAERPRRVSKEPAPGQWTNDLTPYLVAPMDVWNLPWVQKIFLCFSPQSGKTQVAINCMAIPWTRIPGLPCT